MGWDVCLRQHVSRVVVVRVWVGLGFWGGFFLGVCVGCVVVFAFSISCL